jgi:hypothetical protein
MRPGKTATVLAPDGLCANRWPSVGLAAWCDRACFGRFPVRAWLQARWLVLFSGVDPDVGARAKLMKAARVGQPEVSWTIPKARTPLPITAVSGPTISGQWLNSQSPTGCRIATPRCPSTANMIAITISGSA